MKKILSLGMAICLTVSALAAPWDLGKPKKVDEKAFTQPFGKPAFTDPYAVEREIDEAFYNGQRCLHIYMKFDHSVNYALLYTFEHAGEWYGDGGSGIKYFEVVYPPNTLEKHTYFPLHSQDTPTWGWFNEIYLGPF